MYLEIKQFHLLTVLISVLLYIYRFLKYYRLQQVPEVPILLKRVPHINDSLLLTSGIALIFITGFTPFTQAAPWLTYKLIAIFFYILCGLMAMNKSSSPNSRLFYFAASLGWLIAIFSLAVSKNPGLLGI
ncbi:SirB2 family protein [Vibrio zhugei]|uniref:SirB2 family protein n=1 Tax=Vibrio zhugei TaxID=2479546 RepID=A0ABV7CA64_9VIBR|nr:SirB2 family protein [Vibrio zhugei]